MRIGIEVQNMFKPRKHGMDIVIMEILKELQQTGSKHDYYLYAQPDQDDVSLPVENMHIQTAGPASHQTWEQQLLPEVIQGDNLSVLHCTSNTAPMSVKLPLIVTIHNIFYLEKCMVRQGTWYQRYGHLYRQWVVPRIARRAEMIITVSDWEREQIIEGLNVQPEKVKTIYNACGQHFTAERDEALLKAYKKRMHLPDRFVLFFGNTGPKKNLPNVLKAIDILYQRGQLDFSIVMPDISEARLSCVLEGAGLSHLRSYIILTGYIPNNELPNLYKLSELFLYPSLSESFGIPILESMACGTPVITSNVTAMPEVAGKEALLVDPRQPEQIADMILKTMEDQHLRSGAIQHGLNRASMFSWKKAANELASVYDSILN